MVIVLLLSLNIAVADDHVSSSKTDIDSMLVIADSLFFRSNWDSAKKVYQSILKTDDECIDAHRGLGRIASTEEDWSAVKDHFKAIVKTDPDDAEANYYLGIAYRETGKFKALFLRKLDWDRAEKYFNKVIAGDSLFRDVFFQIAQLQRYRGNYREAIDFGHHQLRLRPDLIEPQVKLYRLYRYYITHTGITEAVRWLESLPWQHARFAIGEKYRRQGRIELADSVFRRLLGDDLEIPAQPIFLALARIHYEKGAKFVAEKYFWQAVDNIHDKIDAGLVFEDIKYILTEAELHQYNQLNEIDQIVNFYHTFWARRDPTPAAKINYRLAEHYRRLIFAERNYEYDGFRTWFNNPDQMSYFNFNNVYALNDEFHDMGFIYIRLGKPDEWAKTAGFDVAANESWLYRETRQHPKMMFHFMTHNSPSAWRFAPIISDPQMLEDRFSWDNIFYQLYRASPLERLQMTNGMAVKSQASVATGISVDRHTWERKLKPLSIPFNIATFRGENGKTIIEIYFALALPKNVANAEQQEMVTVETGIALHDSNWQLALETTDEPRLPVGNEDPIIDFYRFEVAPDSYHISFFARPEDSDYLGGWKFDAEVENYASRKLSLSDIQTASLITEEKPGSKFNKHDLFVLPNPGRTFSRKKPIHLYFEVYNLTTNERSTSSFSIEYRLRLKSGAEKKLGNLFGLLSSAGQSSIATSIDREGRGEMSIEYLSIDVTTLKKGSYELNIKLQDQLSGEVVQKSIQINLI